MLSVGGNVYLKVRISVLRTMCPISFRYAKRLTQRSRDNYNLQSFILLRRSELRYICQPVLFIYSCSHLPNLMQSQFPCGFPLSRHGQFYSQRSIPTFHNGAIFYPAERRGNGASYTAIITYKRKDGGPHNDWQNQSFFIGIHH